MAEPLFLTLEEVLQLHDGNKRTGAAAAIVFLKMNAVRLIPDEAALEELVLKTAQGSVGKAEIAKYFRDHGAI